jgi:hypothetical protein
LFLSLRLFPLSCLFLPLLFCTFAPYLLVSF